MIVKEKKLTAHGKTTLTLLGLIVLGVSIYLGVTYVPNFMRFATMGLICAILLIVIYRVIYILYEE